MTKSYGGKFIQSFMGGNPMDEFDPEMSGMLPDPGLPSDPLQTNPAEPTTAENSPTTPATPPVDNSAWDTDGYAKPGYTASDFGDAPSGWDQSKWTNANHQTPKYVVGRILQSAGDLKDPNNRNKVIQWIQQAYPGTTFNGKDTVTIPGIGKVDIFGGAGAGIYSPAWQPIDGTEGSGSATPGFGGYGYSGPNPASPDEVANQYDQLLKKYFGKNSSYNSSMRLGSGSKV